MLKNIIYFAFFINVLLLLLVNYKYNFKPMGWKTYSECSDEEKKYAKQLEQEGKKYYRILTPVLIILGIVVFYLYMDGWVS